jgi:hypothetical protein
MPRNEAGVFSLNGVYLAVTGQDIEATQHNTPLQDFEADANAARPIVAGGTAATTASGARTALGLAIGTDVQAYDAELTALAGLTSAADKLPYFDGSESAAVADLTAFARTLLDDADAATMLATLGTGALAVLDTVDTAQIDDDAITEDKILDGAVTTDKLSVTGIWQTISVATASDDASVDIVLPTSGYHLLRILMIALTPAASSSDLRVQTSTDGGSSFTGSTDSYSHDDTGGGPTSSTFMRVDNDFSANSLTGGNFTFTISSNGNVAKNTCLSWAGISRDGTTGEAKSIFGGGFRKAGEVNDAIRFIMDSGNIASGTFILMGLPS